MTQSRPALEFKLGKNPAVPDPRTLQFASYLPAELPAPPVSVNFYTKVPSWPMYDNDKWGDCTCAAAGHMIQNWTANARGEVTPADEDVDRMYEHFVGDPPPPDTGCNMIDVLKYWRRHGLGTHKITAFGAVSLADHPQLSRAVYMFGAAYIGVQLPNFAVVPGQMLSTPWVVPPSGPIGNAAPNPHHGHCIPAVGYDADNVYIVTWGALKTMSWQFFDAYADEVFAALSEDFISANGENSAGFNFTQLQADLAQLSGS